MKNFFSFVCLFLVSISLMAQSNEPKRRSTYNNGRSTTNYYQRQRQNNSYQSRNTNNQQRSSYNGSGLRAALKRVQEITQEITSGDNARPTARDTRKEVKEYVLPQNHMSGTVSLVVNGEGMTKEEATTSALRSAIEQAFGTFVSANTTLLNDDIVRDEIATVTSGNIKSYKELSSIQNSDGIYNVSVSAVVSIGKLISYAQSHGSSAEFAGQTFMMNMKMRELNKQNEAVALQNLIVQLKSLQDDIFDFEIQTKDPVPDDRAPEVKNENGWKVPVELTIKTNENYLTFVEILNNTLSTLSMSKKDVEDYRKNQTNVTCFSLTDPWKDSHRRVGFTDWPDWYYLRNERKMIEEFASDVCDILYEAQASCRIQSIGGIEYIEYPLMSNVGDFDVSTYRVEGSGIKTGIKKCVHEWDFADVGPYYIILGSEKYRVASLPTEVNYVFAQSIIPFYFTMDELSSLTGFKVVKESMSILENRVKRFKIFADRAGFPYEIQGDIVRLPRSSYWPDIIIDLELNGWADKSDALEGKYRKLKIDFDRKSRRLTLDDTNQSPHLFRKP